jgi:hypothetical protein
MRYLWLVLVVTNAATAAELRSMEVGYDRGAYSLVSEVWFDTAVDPTFKAFSTWEYATQFSRAVVEARDLEPDEQGRPGFFTRNKGCILFFCKSVVREGWVEKEGNHLLRAFADPQRSDFVFSNEIWTFREEDGGTLVVYKLHFDPKFWVPPAIGPYMIKRKMKKEGGEAVDRIEQVARGLE